MKAPIKIGISPGTRMLYIERWEDHWRLPTTVSRDRSLGTFICLFDDGKVERLTIRSDQDDEIWLIKPRDGEK